MRQATIKELKKGEMFTFKPTEYPDYERVYIRDEYDRSTKKYGYTKWSDINHYAEAKGTRTVYTDFTF